MAVRKRGVKNEISLLTALKELCGEREIAPEILYEAIEAALIFAYKKDNGAEKDVKVEINRDTGAVQMFELRTIVEEVTNEAKEISLIEAQRSNPHYEIGEVFRHEISPSNFGRIAAQAAKQFVVQKIREAERGVIYDEFNDRENDIVTGTVERIEDGNVIVTIDKTEAILVPSEQIRGERFQVGDRVKAYVAEVRKIGKGPQIFLSRTHPGFLKRLLEMEVPEVQEGIITVKSIAREAGARAKIAVISKDENIEPVGTCIGPRGMRIQNILNELGEEKVDIVQWNEEPAQFIAAALSPSKVLKVAVNLNEKNARVVVPDNQLSLAIGKAGQNARLAARLTGWKIDIKSKAQTEGEVLPENMVDFEISKKKPKQKKQKNKNKNKNQQQQQQQKNKPEQNVVEKVEPKVEEKNVTPAASLPFESFDDDAPLDNDNEMISNTKDSEQKENANLDFFEEF